MKTSTLKIRKASANLSTLFIFASSALLMTGCEKDTMIQPTATADPVNISSTEKIRANENAYSMLVIDHASARTALPSYKVEVRSDGTVLFEGRKNTAIIGMHKFMIKGEMIRALQSLFIDKKFSNIQDNLPVYADLPTVTTTFRADINNDALTLFDYNAGIPEDLVSLRTQAEEMLMISNFIYTTKDIKEPIVSMGKR